MVVHEKKGGKTKLVETRREDEIEGRKHSINQAKSDGRKKRKQSGESLKRERAGSKKKGGKKKSQTGRGPEAEPTLAGQ